MGRNLQTNLLLRSFYRFADFVFLHRYFLFSVCLLSLLASLAFNIYFYRDYLVLILSLSKFNENETSDWNEIVKTKATESIIRAYLKYLDGIQNIFVTRREAVYLLQQELSDAGLSDRRKVNIKNFPLLNRFPVTPPLKGVHYESCAVVGNSGLLLDHEYGEEIDGHDAVLRFNSAPTIGFEKNVGVRTTFHFLNTRNQENLSHILEMAHVEQNWNDTIYVFQEHSSFRHYLSILESQEQHLPPNVHILTNHFQYDFMRAFCGDINPSLGFVGLIFSAQICNKIDMYGFGMERGKEKQQINHYFVEDGNYLHHSILPTGRHNFFEQMKFFVMLHQKGIVTLIPSPEHLESSDKFMFENGVKTIFMGSSEAHRQGKVTWWEKLRALHKLVQIAKRRETNQLEEQHCMFTHPTRTFTGGEFFIEAQSRQEEQDIEFR